jgi:hypothetical protein
LLVGYHLISRQSQDSGLIFPLHLDWALDCEAQIPHRMATLFPHSEH